MTKTNTYLEETIETKLKNQNKAVEAARAALEAAQDKLLALQTINAELEVVQRRLNRL